MANENPNMDGLTPFEKGKSGNPLGINAGRKPKAYKILDKLLGTKARAREPKLNEAMFDDVFLELLNLSLADLGKVAMNPQSPSYMIYIATMIKEAMKRGRVDLYREIKTQIFGKGDKEGSGNFTIELGFDLGDKYDKPKEAEGEQDGGDKDTI